jgi:hypothetical protein
MGAMEYGKCEVCGKETGLQRTYWKYDLQCECHSPLHFEFVRHCKDCKPQEPKQITVIFETSTLSKKEK